MEKYFVTVLRLVREASIVEARTESEAVSRLVGSGPGVVAVEVHDRAGVFVDRHRAMLPAELLRAAAFELDAEVLEQVARAVDAHGEAAEGLLREFGHFTEAQVLRTVNSRADVDGYTMPTDRPAVLDALGWHAEAATLRAALAAPSPSAGLPE